MRIYVQNHILYSPRVLDVEATDTIRSLKSLIQRAFFLCDEEMERRMLVNDPRDLINEWEFPSTLVDGKDLLADDSTTIQDFCVNDGQILRLGYKGPFKIGLVYKIGGCSEKYEGTCEIEVSCYDTIRHLKHKVEKATGESLTEENFPQVFLSAGAEDRTLLSFGLFRTTLSVYSQQFIYRNRDNKPFDPPSTDELVFPDELVRPSTEFQIVVEFPNMPWRFPLMYEPTDTIGSVRKDILSTYYKSYELLGQTYIKEGLFVLFSGRTLLDDESITLDECSIKHMDSIQVFENASFRILVFVPEWSGTIHIAMKCFDTIGNLKERIRGLIGLPVDAQHLIYKDWYLEDRDRRLVDYGIANPVKYDKSVADKCRENGRFWDRSNEEFIIHLAYSYGLETMIHLATKAGSSLPAATFPDDNTKWELLSGITCDYADVAREEKRSWHHMGIHESVPWRSGATIARLFPGSSGHPVRSSASMFQITVEIPNTLCRFPLTLKRTCTTGTVRKYIIDRYLRHCKLFDERNNIKEEGGCVLFFGTKQLEDDSITLEEYGIRHMDSVQLFEKAFFNVRIIAPEHGVDFCVEARAFDTIGTLKEKIKAMIGITKEEQHLRYWTVLDDYDWLLDDEERRIGDYGIPLTVEDIESGLFPKIPSILVASSKSQRMVIPYV